MDLDGDSCPDLATANENSDNASVLINNGDGTFAAAVNYSAGDEPESIAIGDLDGDTQPDLAIANEASGSFSVLVNNGDGTFAGAVNYNAGIRPQSVAIGDLDGDTQPDLALTISNRNVSVVINRSTSFCSSPPSPPTLTSPTGTVDQAMPVYAWESASCTDDYMLCIQNQYQKNIFYKWYPSASVDNGDGTCDVNPGKVLAPGDYYWLVRGKNQYGIGTWSTALAFTVVTDQVPPEAPTLNTPTGTIDQAIPSFDWNSVDDTDYYMLCIQNQYLKNIFYKWYPAASVDNGDGTCSINPGKVLAPGDYYWLVRGKNQYGIGAWSTSLAFTVDTDQVAPEAPTLNTPTGTIDQAIPSFNWNSLADTDYYMLCIQNQYQKNIFYKWYPSASVDNGDGTCDVNPGKTLTPGNYYWLVKGKNEYGLGSWSAKMPFTVE